MKELYLGMSIIALVLIVLSINLDVSYNYTKANNSKNNKNNKNNKKLNVTNLQNNRPVNIPNRDNMNNSYLRKYYNNNYASNIGSVNRIYNKFYMSN